MQTQVTRMYRVRAVAEMFDVSVSTIYRAIESGRLEAFKIGAGGRGSVRIPDYALRTFEEACLEAASRTSPVDPDLSTTTNGTSADRVAAGGAR
jgi:excisionase family DNA binding protein